MYYMNGLDTMYASLGPGLTLQGNSVRRSHLVIVDFALSLVKSEVKVTDLFFVILNSGLHISTCHL